MAGKRSILSAFYLSYLSLVSDALPSFFLEWQGGSGYARNILFETINLAAVDNPILIDQYYCPRGGCALNQVNQILFILYQSIMWFLMQEKSKFDFNCMVAFRSFEKIGIDIHTFKLLTFLFQIVSMRWGSRRLFKWVMCSSMTYQELPPPR